MWSSVQLVWCIRCLLYKKKKTIYLARKKPSISKSRFTLSTCDRRQQSGDSGAHYAACVCEQIRVPQVDLPVLVLPAECCSVLVYEYSYSPRRAWFWQFGQKVWSVGSSCSPSNQEQIPGLLLVWCPSTWHSSFPRVSWYLLHTLQTVSYSRPSFDSMCDCALTLTLRAGLPVQLKWFAGTISWWQQW